MDKNYFAVGACDVKIDGKSFGFTTNSNTKAKFKDGILTLKNMGLDGNECLLEFDEYYELTLTFETTNNNGDKKDFEFKIFDAKYQGIGEFDLETNECGTFTFLFKVKPKNLKLNDVDVKKEATAIFNSYSDLENKVRFILDSTFNNAKQTGFKIAESIDFDGELKLHEGEVVLNKEETEKLMSSIEANEKLLQDGSLKNITINLSISNEKECSALAKEIIEKIKSKGGLI